MAAVQTYPNIPLGVDSWQPLRIGHFMIVIIIKHLTMALLNYKGKIETMRFLKVWRYSFDPHFHRLSNFTGCVDSIKTIF
jgi:hypothetical protein